MSVSAQTLERLENRDLAAIEDDWLERLDRDPTETGYFLQVSEALIASEQVEIARSLLRLLDEELDERREWRQRLELLLETGNVLYRPNQLHEIVVATLETIYSASPNLSDMMRIAGLHQGGVDLRTLRRQVDRLHSLMLLDVGSLVHMEGKGVGEIVEINFELGRYKIDFERFPGLTIGFKAGAKHLEPLPEGHILRSKIETPEELETLRDEEPSELLRRVLESYEEPRTAAEIKATLDGVVPPAKWSRWWTAARKHPQVLVTSDKRQRYAWAATSDDAVERLRSAFREADLAGQLEIFAKNAAQNPELAEAMAETLSRAAGGLAESDVTTALEVWLVLSRAGKADDEAPFAPAAIVERDEDVASLAPRLGQRAVREALYGEVRSQRPDWADTLLACALAEPDPAVVGDLARDLESGGAEHRTRLAETALSRPREHPAAFVWLARAAAEDEALRRVKPLRLFRQLLGASSQRAFAPYRSALEPLLESGGTLPKLIADLGEDDAEAALDAVRRAPLEDYQRTPLVNALELRFESLREESDDILYALRQSIAERQEEARRLQEEEIPANREAIQEAVALGDLRENFEYKSARQRHEYLSARLGGLQADLARVEPIDLDAVGASEVRIGATVVLEGAAGRREISVLGPWESDPEAGRLSYRSDLGKALIGKSLGDTLEIEEGAYEVVAIRPFEPAAAND